MTALVYLEHEGIGGACQVPDDPTVIESYVGRGWVVKPTPAELDPDAPNTGAVPAPVVEGDPAGEQDDPPAPEAAPEQPAAKVPAKNRTAAPADEQNGE